MSQNQGSASGTRPRTDSSTESIDKFGAPGHDVESGLVAAIYARTSSKSQRFGYSIDEQTRRCWTFCEECDWQVAFVFTDHAESGRDTERPQFQRMLTNARDGLFDVVVFWKLDRFCRSLSDLVKTEEVLHELGVGLHSVTEVLDTTNPVGRFNFRNLASAAELESDLISQRVKMGMYGLAQEHKWPNSQPPLGYEKDGDGQLVVNSTEQETVQLIFELYLEKRSMPAVAFTLNEQGIRTKDGEQWCRQSVGKVLKNELYIGQYSIAGYEEYVEEYQILSDELFEAVTETRYRFQYARENIEPARREAKVKRVLAAYQSDNDEDEDDY
jgi:site-specific DNA recombinase